MPRWSELSRADPARAVPPGDATARRLAPRGRPSATSARSPAGACRARCSTTPTAPPERRSACAARGQAFERVEFRPRVLRDVSAVDPSTTLLGSPSALPLVFAPTGFTRLMHTEGEPAVGRASPSGSASPTRCRRWARPRSRRSPRPRPAARRWFQLYLWRDREASAALVERARAAGLRGAGADRRHPGRRSAAARRPQRLHDPAGADPADHGQRRRAPALVGRPAHHRRRWSSPR